jgi:hypothetical protein
MSIKMPRKQGSEPSAEEFIAGATALTPSPAPAQPPPQELPWRHPHVREDLRVQVNAKLPEKLMIQRDWLAARLRIKKQDILEIALRSWVERELRKLGLDKE